MSNNSNNLRRFDDFEIDLDKKILWNGKSHVDLPVKAVELLCELIENEGQVVSKEDLLNNLWHDSFVEEAVLPQNVYLLRKSFEQYGSKRTLIETIPRRGYRFRGETAEVAEALEITIERQVIERKFVAEADFSDESGEIIVADQNRSAGSPQFAKSYIFSRKIFLSVCTIAAIIFIWIGGWVYPGYFGANSRPASESNAANLTYERLTESGRAYYVGLSPDDQNAAYVIHTPDNKYSLTLHHLTTGSETVIVAPQEAHLNHIVFSPDGNYIYYAAQHGKKPNTVFRIPIYGGSSQAIVKDLSHHFSLSPDGEWLAFYRWELKIGVHIEMCRSRDGGDRRIIRTRTGNDTYKIWGIAPEFSPNGKKLLAAGAVRADESSPYKDELLEIEIDGGTETNIKTPDWYRIAQGYWEKDGKGIFVMVREKIGQPVQIWHLEYPNGTGRNVTNDQRDYREFRLSSGSDFLMAATWATTGNLFLVSSEDPQNVRQLTFDTSIQNGGYGLKWTVDGRSIIYSRTKGFSTGNLWIFDTESTESRQLTFDEGSMQNYIDVTADGKSAVFASNRTGVWNIWQIGIDGDDLHQLTFGAEDSASEISPDGQWLYYSGKGLWKMSLGGGEPIKVMEDTPGTTRISPADPKQLVSYYADPKSKDENKWKFILYRESDPRDFTDLNIPSIILFDWKLDGSGIYYADTGESFNNLWFVSTKDRKKTQITNFGDQKISNLSLSPDGKTFVVARGSVSGSILKISGIK